MPEPAGWALPTETANTSATRPCGTGVSPSGGTGVSPVCGQDARATPVDQRQVVVLGAGGTGLFMADVLGRVPGFTMAGFLDDDPAKQSAGCGGWPVLGPLEAWRQLDEGTLFLSSLYGAKVNERFCQRVEELAIPEGRWASVIDPAAVVSPRASVGRGALVGPGCVVEPAAELGDRCALLGHVYVSHHARLESYVACANSVSIAGGVVIGRAAFLGANCSVRQYTRIGPGAVVGMGSVVLEDVPFGQTVAGNPARPLGAVEQQLPPPAPRERGRG